MKKIKDKINKKRILSILCVVVLSIFCGLLFSSYSAQELIPSVEIDSKKLSYQEKTPGSFRMTKSAKWISSNQVKVTLDLDTVSYSENKGKDIIFIIDTSTEMKNDKILEVKKEIKNIVNTLLLDSNHKISIITYSDTSKIVTSLSNDKEAINDIVDGIEVETEGRNLYQAYKNLEVILKETPPSKDRNTSVILIAGGYANKETPNEVGEYEYLKTEYPSVSMKGIQYRIEGGIEQLNKVSDQIYLSDRETFKDHLYESLELTKSYESLDITESINEELFDIEKIEKVKVTEGTVKKDKNKLTWELEGLPSGKRSQLEYVIEMKELSEGEIYAVSKKNEIRYVIGETEEEIESTVTPVLGRYFEVTYEGNAPSGCTINKVPDKSTYEIYEMVEISKEVPICEGYDFVGWESATSGVLKASSTEFIMPESDVIMRAEWSKITMSLGLEGEVYQYLEGSIRKVNHIDTEEIWKYKENTTKIVFQDTLSEIENAVESYDISSEGNGSIMSYVVSNGDETYTIYIQGDSKVTANEDSSYLFDRFTRLETIEGMEYLDTSKVTNMSHMFGRCSSLKSIDLSHMDTSKVIDMSYMFHDCTTLTKVDLSELDLSKVEDMSGMFEGDSSLKEVDLPSEGLPNVDDMGGAFKDCPNLEVITPEDLKIPDDTNTDEIFGGGNNLPEPPIKKEYNVIIIGNTHGTIEPNTLTIGFGKTGVTTMTPSRGYYLESVSCTNGYTTNAVIDPSSSEPQEVIISNNNQNQGSECTVNYAPATYKIEYNLDGGELEEGYPESYTMESEEIILPTPTKEGYNFIGWTTTLSVIPQMDLTIPTGSTGNKSYTANWAIKQYTVTVNANAGGTVSESSLTIEYNGTAKFTVTPSNGYYLNSISCTNGYTAEAIIDSSSSEPQEVTISNNKQDANSTCSVEFKTATYKIEYNLDGGELEEGYPESYTIESEGITLPTPTKEGHNFIGWTIGEEETPVKTETIPTGSTGNRVYKANWAIKTYHISLTTGENGTISNTSLTINYGETATFTATPNSDYHIKKVSCTNGYTTSAKVGAAYNTAQEITISNNKSDNESTCTVTFNKAVMMKAVASDYTGELWQYRTQITKVVFQDKVQSISGTAYSYDISADTNKKVMARLVATDSIVDSTSGSTQTGYTAYIQGDGGVIANPAGHYIFRGMTNLTAIEGMEYLDTSELTDMNHMFSGCSKLTGIDLSNFETSNVINMSYMFGGCSSLTSLDVSHLDTLNVTDMSYMFALTNELHGYTKLKSLDLSNWNTKNVIDMSGMFYYTESLKDLNLSDWDTSNVTNMRLMFNRCKSLTSLDLSSFDTSNVTDMYWMFMWCYKLADLNVSNFDTSNVTNMNGMFGNTSLTNLDVSHFNTSNVTDMGSMFHDCRSLISLDVSTFDTSNVTEMSWMFSGCSSLTSLDLSHFNTSNVIKMLDMFDECSSLTSLDLSNFDTSNVTRVQSLFSNCSSLTDLNISNWNLLKLQGDIYFSGCTSLTNIIADNLVLPVYYINSSYSNVRFNSAPVLKILSVKNMTVPSARTSVSGIFGDCTSLESIDLSGWNNPKITSLASMFKNCTNLKIINLTNFDMSNVKNMSNMFSGCSSLTTVDTTLFNTSSVTTMLSMFDGCSALTTLDLSHMDTSKVTTMKNMFNGCTSLATLDLTPLTTTSVTTMESMFSECSSLTGLDFSLMDTSNVTTMKNMFNGCSKLATLDLSALNMSNVINIDSMVANCSSLTNLALNNWNISKISSHTDLFINCDSLSNISASGWTGFSGNKLRTIISEYFGNVQSLKSLNLSNWNTSSVTDMSRMFSEFTFLTTINLSNWDTSNVTTMESMFEGCNLLTSLSINSFTFTKVRNTVSMFNGCNKLSMTIKIDSSTITSYNNMFKDAATASGAKIRVNYTSAASSKVTSLVNTKSSTSNVVKGSQVS